MATPAQAEGGVMADVKTKMHLPFIKLYTGDFRSMTVALSLAEKGAFMYLVLYFWDTGKPPADDDRRLSRIVGCSISEWRRMKPNLIDAAFEVRGGFWRIPYFEQIRDKSEETHRKNSERARKAANARYSKGAA